MRVQNHLTWNNSDTCSTHVLRVRFTLFMDNISGHSQGPKGVLSRSHWLLSLLLYLFADDNFFLSSSSQDLQHALGRFAAKCEMWVNTSKSEIMVLNWVKVTREKNKDFFFFQLGVGRDLLRSRDWSYVRFHLSSYQPSISISGPSPLVVKNHPDTSGSMSVLELYFLHVSFMIVGFVKEALTSPASSWHGQGPFPH